MREPSKPGLSGEVPLNLKTLFLVIFWSVEMQRCLTSGFVVEARRKDSCKYPCSTMNILLSCLKRHMVKLNPETPNFLDETDPRFRGLQGTRDTIARQLREEGVGATVCVVCNCALRLWMCVFFVFVNLMVFCELNWSLGVFA